MSDDSLAAPATMRRRSLVSHLLGGLWTSGAVALGACAAEEAAGPAGTPDAALERADAGTIADLPEQGLVALIEQTRLGSVSKPHIGSHFRTGPDTALAPARSSGACTLWVRACDPPCDPWFQRCAQGACEPHDHSAPAPTVGLVTIEGLLGGTLTLSPTKYGYAVPALPDDLFAPGDTLRASAPGEDLPAFDLTVRGVSPMDIQPGPGAAIVTFGDTIEESRALQLTRGQDAVLRWTPGDGERVRLQLQGDNTCHGCAPEGFIRCEVADEGAVLVAGELLADLPQPSGPNQLCGGTDCLPSWIERVSEAHVAVGAGRVTLQASSRVEMTIDLQAAPRALASTEGSLGCKL